MDQPFRLLVTGSRTWEDVRTIEQALAVILHRHPEGVLLVHGACPRGADTFAARAPGYRTEAHPADWHRHGRVAGYRRNAEMIALGADGCAAFIPGPQPRQHRYSPAGQGSGHPRLAPHAALTGADAGYTRDDLDQ